MIIPNHALIKSYHGRLTRTQYAVRNVAANTLCNAVTQNVVDTLNTPLVTTIHSNNKIWTRQ